MAENESGTGDNKNSSTSKWCLWCKNAVGMKIQISDHKNNSGDKTLPISVSDSQLRSRITLRVWWTLLQVLFITLSACAAGIFTDASYHHDMVVGDITTKVRGTLYAELPTEYGGNRTWDTTDLVVPPRGPDEFFVMTRVLPRLVQAQDVCDEDPRVGNIKCQEHKDCEKLKGRILTGSHGPITGQCVNSTFYKGYGIKVCEIYGWCPVQHDEERLPVVTLPDTGDFTVFIKNDIEFPDFKKYWRNFKGFDPSDIDDLNVVRCLYNESDPRYRFCPIFKLKTIVEGSGANYTQIAEEGGVIRVVINWNCDLDDSLGECIPTYTFKRMDRSDYGYDLSFSKYENGSRDDRRDLIKAYGIRFLVTVSGSGKQFYFSLFAGAFGQYMGYSAIVSILFGLTIIFCGYTPVDSYIRTNCCLQCFHCVHDEDARQLRKGKNNDTDEPVTVNPDEVVIQETAS